MPSISPRLPLILAIIAALGMVLATAWQAYDFWQAERRTAGEALSPVTSATPGSRQQTPDLSLASVALFGVAGQSQAAVEADIDNLPETNLQLVLRGVMSAAGDFPGSALVEDSKGQTEAYMVGSELPGNASLRSVRPDRIIIERGGALENLYFPQDEDRSGFAVAANDSNSAENSGVPDYTDQTARPASFPGPDTDQTSDSRREEIRQRLEQLRNRLRNNN